MTGLLVAALLMAAVTVAARGTRPARPRGRLRRRGGPTTAAEQSARGRHRVVGADLEDQVRILRQLSALLAAGRPLTTVWTDVLAGRAAAAASTADAPAGSGAVDDTLRTVERAARWGHDPTEALRNARRRPAHGRGDPTLERALADGWAGLADCIDIARATGAPLAGLLDRFAAAQADARDADAARAAALAGPAVTARILRWLPVAGLGLGVVMGVDPLRLLTTTPAGGVLVAAAAGLMLLGHVWVRRLLAAAA